MKKKQLLGGAVVAILLALVAGLTLAQSPEGTSLGTAFTYQGHLKSGGLPVDDACDLQFTLWDAETDGAQVGPLEDSAGVDISGGLFTVQLDFGDGVFHGETRWLEIAVQCPGDPGYTTLAPRQALTAAPYALALPGLWTQQNITSTNIIGGFGGNWVADGVWGATVGGGGDPWGGPNRVSGHYATVGGGGNNDASGDSSTISGGANNAASGQQATVGGGANNTTSGQAATIAGGYQNVANREMATVAGGHGNTASGGAASIGGGWVNTASANWATVAGGWDNTAGVELATVGGGYGNTASSGAATIGGGHANTVTGPSGTVSGGALNLSSGGMATVGGGDSNIASGQAGFVGGGQNNTAGGDGSTVAGGQGNEASGHSATVAGGGENLASATGATVAGGRWNTASGDWSPTVGGGENNTAGVDYATVGGGTCNSASGVMSTIGGGNANVASGQRATVAGGEVNTASGARASIGGGKGNVASGDWSPTVCGGEDNTASAGKATVGGGWGNTASGYDSTVPGGSQNRAEGHTSFAAGHRAIAQHSGALVWADLSGYDFLSSGDNSFNARATGGFWLWTGLDGSGNPSVGAALFPGSSAWSPLSDRNLKANITPVDAQQLLVRLAQVPVTTWNYTTQDTSIRHIGPMAQDFHAAFGVGEDDRRISTVDADGVALAAIQALYAENQALKAQLAGMEARLAALEQGTARVQPAQTGARLPMPWLLPGGLVVAGGALAGWRRRSGGAR